jgi:glycosyltransferase involved in cell wall biosynthesis
MRPGFRLRCRGSLGEAAAYAIGLHLQQPRLFEYADRFVAVSDATASQLIELGLPAERTCTLTNFVPAKNFAKTTRAGDGRYALASGRLVGEKGFGMAIAASRLAGVPLVIAGDGPDAARLRELAVGADVRFTGWLNKDALADVRSRAAVVLVPSRSDEAFPYSALDALADGVPVLASNRGGLPEVVGPEAVLPTDDVRMWSERLSQLFSSSAARHARGAAVLEDARLRFSEDRYYDGLMRVYGD